MENRKEEREQKKIRVRLKDGDVIYPAHVTNISKLGMSVKAGHLFPAFKVIDILVKIAQVVIPLRGSVRWVNKLAEEDPEQQYEMGVSLQSPPHQYCKHFD